MAHCTSVDTNPPYVSVDPARQLLPGRIEHALNPLLDHKVDLAHFDAWFRNDTTGATAYPPAMLPTVLFALSHGIVRSRPIERVCPTAHDIMALCGKTRLHFTTIAHFVSTRRDDIAHVFATVLAVCDG